MKKQLLKRHELDLKHTWDMSLLFKDELIYQASFDAVEKDVDLFCETYEHNLKTAELIHASLVSYQDISSRLTRLSAYSSLQSSTDSISEDNQMRQGRAMMRFLSISKKMAFFNTELKQTSNDVLLLAADLSLDHAFYIKELVDAKSYALSPDVEKALVALSPVLNAPYQNYNRFKLADMSFDNFDIDGVTYSNSFTLFENEYEHEENVHVRRKAYETFYAKLATYQHGFASNYQTQLQKEKNMADLRGHKSVFDYLLYDQKVPKAFMDRQIDLIMEKLAPAMRKYATLIKEVHGLERMTYADLKIALDPQFEPRVTIDESKKLLMEGLSILGPEYNKMIERSFDERWIDFPQNQGKSTGGFCQSPYGAPSYILVNWNGRMDEVMVLAHEIGHAGHFQYANSHQTLLHTRPSLYFIEAPSTTNELLMANHLIKHAKSPREKTWIQSVTISRTYFHNFVTHLLEAAFQRDVYNKVDKKEPLSAHILNQLKLNVLKKFWGDSVDIPDYAGLTWMRQPHYFMGLYPYTYSAGLTLGTKVAKMIETHVIKPSEWIEVLKTGGTKTPLELAHMVGVDLSTDHTLIEVIGEISSMIDSIYTSIQSRQ